MNNSDEVRILQHNYQNCALAQFSLPTFTTLFCGQMQDGSPVMPLLLEEDGLPKLTMMCDNE